MTWWSRLRSSRRSQRGLIWSVELNLPGWIEVPAKEEMRLWNDSEGDTLSVMKVTAANTLPDFCDEAELTQECRRIAEYQNGGLIEVSRAEEGRIGPSVSLIYKLMPQPLNLIYSGQIVTSWLIWTIVAHERGTTGVRPSIIFAHLVQTGKFDPKDFERLWAQDPYDPTYQGVDKSLLRHVWEDPCYDDQFPHHPLSKVRRVLAAVRNNVTFTSDSPGTDFPNGRVN